MKTKFLLTLLLVLTGFSISRAQTTQMEKRRDALYHLNAFVNSYPAIGTAAPDLEVRSLGGDTVRLSDYAGKRLIVIKGSYT